MHIYIYCIFSRIRDVRINHRMFIWYMYGVSGREIIANNTPFVDDRNITIYQYTTILSWSPSPPLPPLKTISMSKQQDTLTVRKCSRNTIIRSLWRSEQKIGRWFRYVLSYPLRHISRIRLDLTYEIYVCLKSFEREYGRTWRYKRGTND